MDNYDIASKTLKKLMLWGKDKVIDEKYKYDSEGSYHTICKIGDYKVSLVSFTWYHIEYDNFTKTVKELNLCHKKNGFFNDVTIKVSSEKDIDDFVKEVIEFMEKI